MCRNRWPNFNCVLNLEAERDNWHFTFTIHTLRIYGRQTVNGQMTTSFIYWSVFLCKDRVAENLSGGFLFLSELHVVHTCLHVKLVDILIPLAILYFIAFHPPATYILNKVK